MTIIQQALASVDPSLASIRLPAKNAVAIQGSN